MKPLLTFTFLIIICFSALSQKQREGKISIKDSRELKSFWKEFKESIDEKDKIKLSNLFNFPFYCIQCADYVSPNDTTGETVLVNRKIFDTAIYKLFFKIPNQNSLNKQMWTEDFVFRAAHYDKTVFIFSYVTIVPSKSFEGAQGLVYVKKIKGKFKIVSMDTVP